jgi:tryptophan halogenase
MRVGRTRRAWVGNCVSLGLASGFTDPLHATSILLIERGLFYLDMYFPDSDFSPVLAEVYNRRMTEEFEGTLGFIFLHYFASPRRDTPFWCAATSAVAPAPAAEILELWDRLGLESGALAAPLTHVNETFGTCAVPNMLVGVGRLPRRGREEVRRDRTAPPPPAEEDAAAAEQDRLAALPDHATYLEQLNSGSLDAFRELFLARLASGHRGPRGVTQG